jgi:hypothetical protein
MSFGVSWNYNWSMTLFQQLVCCGFVEPILLYREDGANLLKHSSKEKDLDTMSRLLWEH